MGLYHDPVPLLEKDGATFTAVYQGVNLDRVDHCLLGY